MKKQIKNMVSNSCISQVVGILLDMGLPFQQIKLGEVSLEQKMSTIQELDHQFKS